MLVSSLVSSTLPLGLSHTPGHTDLAVYVIHLHELILGE